MVFDRIDGLGIGDDSKAGKALFSLKSSGGNHHDSNAAAVKKKKRKPLTGAATYDPFCKHTLPSSINPKDNSLIPFYTVCFSYSQDESFSETKL